MRGDKASLRATSVEVSLEKEERRVLLDAIVGIWLGDGCLRMSDSVFWMN